MDKVAASLREFGWQQPIVVEPDGVILVGHVRRLTALQLGWTEAPVVVAAGLSPAQCKAYRLADNRAHEEAGWDRSLLSVELAELSGLTFDLTLTGFGDAELARLMPVSTPEDTAELLEKSSELLKKWDVKRGQVWLIGRHSLVCGSCLEPEHVASALGGQLPFMLVTDPHPTQKPVDLMFKSLVNHGEKGDGVYEPFGGSGTTMAAAEMAGRFCCAVEIEPRYCAVILERMSAMGLTPTLEVASGTAAR